MGLYDYRCMFLNFLFLMCFDLGSHGYGVRFLYAIIFVRLLMVHRILLSISNNVSCLLLLRYCLACLSLVSCSIFVAVVFVYCFQRKELRYWQIIIFSWFLLLLNQKVTGDWQRIIVVTSESLWEILENSNFIINKYRADTIAIGYQGDTIINSLSDIICCVMGFTIAKYLGFRKSFIIFILTEIILFIWIRDNLILNIIMLLYPIKEIKQWQIGQ